MRIVWLILILQVASFANWNHDILYFLLIDRFHNGDTTNDAGSNPASHELYTPDAKNETALKTYQGGDLQGIIDKLPYLKSLGITAIWLSPVYDNSDTDFNSWWPYHGYHPGNFYKVDEHFGDLALLKELVDTAHAMDLKIILDIVFNQAAPDHPWLQERPDWFHEHSGVDASTSIQNWQDQDELENKELAGLPDFAQENPEVYDFLYDVAAFWIKETGCDGFRLDAVKHVPKAFWQRMNEDIHKLAGDDFLLLGEVFSGDTKYVAAYQECGFNSLFDIPMYYTIKRVFAQGGQVNLLSEQIFHNKKHYADSLVVSTLIDNHDVARFSYWAKDRVKSKIKLALAFAWSLNGLPMLYYGTEAALSGAAPENEITGDGQDYLNRLCMPWAELESRHADLVSHIQKLNALRTHSPALQNGRIVEIYKDFGVYAFIKYTSGDHFFIILNNASTEEKRMTQFPADIFPLGGVMTNALDSTKYIYDDCALSLTLPPFSALYLTAEKFNSSRVQALPPQCPVTMQLTGDLKMISFTLRHNSSIQSVHLAGDFNGWNAETHPLQLEHGFWRIELPLKKGKYRYKFVLNGTEWIADETAEAFERDPYGSKNSVVNVK